MGFFQLGQNILHCILGLFPSSAASQEECVGDHLL